MYLLIMVGKVVFGPLKEPARDDAHHHPVLPADLTRREICVLAPLAVVCLYIGFQPAVLTDAMEPAIEQMLAVYPDKVNAVQMADAESPAEAEGLVLVEVDSVAEEGRGDG
jgi:NADH:ubiquinone oxidoreductase subunit 4 (subunit M)